MSFLALFHCSKMNVIMIKITKFLKRRGKMKVGVVDITNPGIRWELIFIRKWWNHRIPAWRPHQHSYCCHWLSIITKNKTKSPCCFQSFSLVSEIRWVWVKTRQHLSGSLLVLLWCVILKQPITVLFVGINNSFSLSIAPPGCLRKEQFHPL